MKIGIIAAENAEMMAIKNIMTDISEELVYNLTFTHGKIENKDCVLVECGVGKVNAARTTQILIDKFEVDAVINVGSAGGLNPELDFEYNRGRCASRSRDRTSGLTEFFICEFGVNMYYVISIIIRLYSV